MKPQPSVHAEGAWSRRALLAAGMSGVLLAGCSQASTTRASSGLIAPKVKYSIHDMRAGKPFYIAHRGSGDNWTEHTAESYRESAAIGAKAIEISVHATSDNILICHHDLNTLRLTGKEFEIAETSYATLQELNNDAREWLGPASPLLPIPVLKSVLNEHAADRVIFIEDKPGTNTQNLLDLMSSYPDAQNHFVWKQPASSDRFVEARARGFKTWGYFSPDIFHRFGEYYRNFDYVGIHHSATDDQVRELVSYGKPVICWEVHTRSMRDRLVKLGVHTMMCSNVPYVTTNMPRSNRDQFASGLRAHGDLPWTIDWGWDEQPAITPATASLRIDSEAVSSYRMGSMCPIQESAYELHFEMRWLAAGLQSFQHAGIAFGQADDQPYRVLHTTPVGGYHLIMRPTGRVELFRRAAGETSGTFIAGIDTSAPGDGQWVGVRVSVTPAGIRFSRDENAAWSAAVDDTTYRGGYLSLCKNYTGAPAVEFRRVRVA